jgi:hypothetical protein
VPAVETAVNQQGDLKDNHRHAPTGRLPAAQPPPAPSWCRLPLISKQRGHPPPFFRLGVEPPAQVVTFVLQQRHLFAQSVNLGL